MKKFLTILICFVLLTVLACPITADDEQYLLTVNFVDMTGNVVSAPLTMLFTDTVNVDNIPLDVNGFNAYNVIADDTYSQNISITEEGYLAINSVKNDLFVSVMYTPADGYYSVGGIVVNVSYVDDFGNVLATADSANVYADANGMMHVLPSVCGVFYPNGLVDVIATESFTQTFNEVENTFFNTPETEVTTVSETYESVDTTVSQTPEVTTSLTEESDVSETTTAVDTTPLPEDTTVSVETTVVTTYSATTLAVTAPDVEIARYNYCVNYLDMSVVDANDNFFTIYSENNITTISPIVKGDDEYASINGTYKLYTKLVEEVLLSKVSNFDENAVNDIFFYYKLSTTGGLIITRTSGSNDYKTYTLELVGGDYLARFALSGNDIIMFENIPEGTYLITGDDLSSVVSVTRDVQAIYEVTDDIVEAQTQWFTEQYSTTVQVNVGITE